MRMACACPGRNQSLTVIDSSLATLTAHDSNWGRWDISAQISYGLIHPIPFESQIAHRMRSLCDLILYTSTHRISTVLEIETYPMRVAPMGVRTEISAGKSSGFRLILAAIHTEWEWWFVIDSEVLQQAQRHKSQQLKTVHMFVQSFSDLLSCIIQECLVQCMTEVRLVMS